MHLDRASLRSAYLTSKEGRWCWWMLGSTTKLSSHVTEICVEVSHAVVTFIMFETAQNPQCHCLFTAYTWISQDFFAVITMNLFDYLSRIEFHVFPVKAKSKESWLFCKFESP